MQRHLTARLSISYFDDGRRFDAHIGFGMVVSHLFQFLPLLYAQSDRLSLWHRLSLLKVVFLQDIISNLFC
jgi:hypothetical protein